MLLEPSLAVPKSRYPSPSKSPAHTDQGELPVEKVFGEPSVPSPLPSKTETLFDPLFTVTTSRIPSLLTSPVTISSGEVPSS
ncbi:hypothetical protein ES703_18151 [subsurface metagenome]